MESLRSILESAGRDLEPQVRSQLDGFFGGMVRAYLPQTWVFRADGEVAALTVDRSGKVSVADGDAPNPDVTVETTRARLSAALRSRSRGTVPPGSLVVTPLTAKGRTAFDYLRGRLGL